MQRRYKRYFVMLEEEDKGFSNAKSETTKGYAKIEVRNDHGTLSLYCQNLKKLEEKKERYRLYLMHTEDSLEPTVVDIGPIKVDNNGKGEIVWEFNAENVKGFKKSIEDFDVLTLVVETLEESQRILAPLVGYIHKKKSNWKPLFQKKLFVVTRGTEAQDLLKPQEQPIQIDITTEKPLEEKAKFVEEINAPIALKEEPSKEEILIPEEKTAKIKEEISEDIKEERSEEIKQEKEQPLEKPEVSAVENNLDQESDSKFSATHRVQENLNVSENTYLNINHQTEVTPLQQYVESTLKSFPTVAPFDTKLKNYQWWEIHYNNQTGYRAYMPFIAHIEAMMNPYYYHYPYYSSSEYHRQLYRYRHHIFGICYDEKKKAKYYVYGIPGKKARIEQPYTGSTGFVYWHASHYEQFKQEGFGYWLMHINAETGKVEEPLTATEV